MLVVCGWLGIELKQTDKYFPFPVVRFAMNIQMREALAHALKRAMLCAALLLFGFVGRVLADDWPMVGCDAKRSGYA